MGIGEWFEKHARALFFILGIAIALTNVVVIVQVQARAECQVQYNASVPKVLEIRARLSSASDANQNALILGVAKLTATPDPKRKPTATEQKKAAAQYRRLFTQFTAEATRIEAERAANPVPPIPDC